MTVCKTRIMDGDVGKKYGCNISKRLADRLGKSEGSHIKLETGDGWKTFYRVNSIHQNNGIQINEEGRDKVNADAGDEARISGTVPVHDLKKAKQENDLYEELFELGDQVLVSCAHGGNIEKGTSDIGLKTFRHLYKSKIPCSFWSCLGYGENSFQRWHLKKLVEAADSYPLLNQLDKNQFNYSVGIHMQNYSYVAVGGRASRDVRELFGEKLDAFLPSNFEVRTSFNDMKLTGNSKKNTTNYFAENGGVHLELPYKACMNQREEVAEAVAAGFHELL